MALVFLADGPCHGYDVFDALRARGFVTSNSYVYRTLQALEESGELRSYWQESECGGSP